MSLPQVTEFKYFWVLFMSDGKTEVLDQTVKGEEAQPENKTFDLPCQLCFTFSRNKVPPAGGRARPEPYSEPL